MVLDSLIGFSNVKISTLMPNLVKSYKDLNNVNHKSTTVVFLPEVSFVKLFFFGISLFCFNQLDVWPLASISLLPFSYKSM
jgi:hypothetical protein